MKYSTEALIDGMSERIKKIRKNRLNLSQEDFSDKIGTSVTTVSRIERNRLPKIPITTRIAKEGGRVSRLAHNGEGESFRSGGIE